ncbi:MAG TPA: iron-containing redox enzyme family protein [Candidatus Limnocylindrales bacterium]|nr:iron-containing redox enzyme family protein [Candidatus Limnocylindrales bacterium]
MNLVKDLCAELDQMVNDQFDSIEFKAFLGVPLTLERGRFYVIQNALYTSNRRDCWGYVQGGAPLEVKRVVWEHESDELINDPRAGMDHYNLTVKQGEVIGLKREDFDNAQVPAMAQACFHAWHHIAMRGHWLTSYAASHMLERRNNGKIVKGGGMSFRVGKKFENELGINLKRMISLDVHVVADTEHSENISEMFEKYVKTPQDCERVLEGARESMAIDRAYRGALGFYMERIN